MPSDVKNSADFQQINTLRVLVNCLKHSGVVNKELAKLDPSFGDIDDEISGDIGMLYENYKACAARLLEKTYEYLRIQKSDHPSPDPSW